MSDWMSEHIEAIALQEEEARRLAAQRKAERREAQARQAALSEALKQAQIVADGMVADAHRMLVSKGIPTGPLIAHQFESWNRTVVFSGVACSGVPIVGQGWALRNPSSHVEGVGDDGVVVDVPGLWIDIQGGLRTAEVSTLRCMHPYTFVEAIGYSYMEIKLEKIYPRVVWHKKTAGKGVSGMRLGISGEDGSLGRILVLALKNLGAL